MIFVLSRQRTSIFRRYQNAYLREYTAQLNPNTVLNLGATPEDGDKEGRRYRDYFPSASFNTMELGESDAPGHIQADLTNLPDGLPQYDLVLAMSTIEHIDRPWVAAKNITTLIRPGGHLYIAMPFFYPVHEGPYYGDHWRATPSGITALFDELIVVRHDHYPTSVFAVRDRATYWRSNHSAYAGFSMLLERAA